MIVARRQRLERVRVDQARHPARPSTSRSPWRRRPSTASSFGSCLELDGPALLARRPVALDGGVGGLLRGARRAAVSGAAAHADDRRLRAATCSPLEPERPIRTPDAQEQHGECHAGRRHARRDAGRGRSEGGGGAAAVGRPGEPALLHERQPRAVPPRAALEAVALVVGERRVTARAVGLCPWCSTRCAFQDRRERRAGHARAARIADEEDLEARPAWSGLTFSRIALPAATIALPRARRRRPAAGAGAAWSG